MLIHLIIHHQKLHVNIITNLIRKKLLSTGKPPNSTVIHTCFPHFTVLLQSSDFIIGNKYCQLFSLKWYRFIYSFLRKYLPNTQIWINMVMCQLLFQVKKKKVALNPNNTNLMLFLEKPPYFSVRQSYFVYFHSITPNIKKIYTSMCGDGW